MDIREATKVTGITQQDQRWRLTTDKGSVSAERVLVATNALTGKFWPQLDKTLIPIQVYQGATAPLPAEVRKVILRNNPAVSDTRRDIRAYHYDRNFRLVTGGTHTLWHNARERGVASLQKKLAEASNKIEQTGVRTRAIQRQLRDVESVPGEDATKLLGE